MYAAAASASGPGGPSQRRPAAVNPLRHLAHLQGFSLLMDLKGTFPTYTKQDRADFVIKDLKVPANDVLLIFPDHITELVVLTLETKEVYDAALERLQAGVPWAAAAGELVYGSAADEAVVAVRISNIPIGLASGVLLQHMKKFGTVLTHRQGRDRLFPRASDGILHISMVINDEATLPHFIQVVDGQGRLSNSLPVHLDSPRRCCYRCGRPNHLGRRCQAASRAPDASESIWSTLVAPPPPGGPIAGKVGTVAAVSGQMPPPPAQRHISSSLPPPGSHSQAAPGGGGEDRSSEEEMEQSKFTPTASRKRTLVVCSSSSVSDLEKEATAVDKNEPEFVMNRKQRRKMKRKGTSAADQAEEEKPAEVQEDVLVTPLATVVPPASSLEDLVLTPSSKWGGEGCDGGGGGV